MTRSRVWRGLAYGVGWLIGAAAHAQQPDTTSTNALGLPAVSVSATRSTLPLAKLPFSVQIVARRRFIFSQPPRLSIRGLGSRSARAGRCNEVWLDRIPPTLPHRQRQLSPP